MAIQAIPVELESSQEAAILTYLHKEIGSALEAHRPREVFLADLLRAYKAQPEVETKNFPWPGASNVVVPYVAISVDAVAARLQRSILGAKDPVEAHLSGLTPFQMSNGKPLGDKDIRDWVKHFLENSGASDKLRSVFFDVSLNGDGFVKPIWVEESETYHGYDDGGNVVEVPVPGYTGVKWHVAPGADVITPRGFDNWSQLPWFAHRLRFSWSELKRGELDGTFQDVDAVKHTGKKRDDERHKVTNESERIIEETQDIYDLFEVHGLFEIPPGTAPTATDATAPAEGSDDKEQPPLFQELILLYSHTARKLIRKIYNPFFGRARHFVKIPYLVQSHQMYSLGVAEMSLPFQKEASTAHNQVIDAATAANAGIIVTTPDTNIGRNEEIYPGKHVKVENPGKDFAIYHLSEPSGNLANVEERAAFLMEKRTGVSVYNLGMESATVGSRATATGTTALITEGNIRFWVSIDDMRKAIEELLYLTVQQEQQFRPQGYEWAPGRYIQFPPGDPRVTLGLSLKLSSESVNRDLEIQQLQVLIQVLNDYYGRVNQAAAILFNPMFPPQQKMVIVQIMNAAGIIIKKFVERFDIENLDEVVPTIMTAMQNIGNAMGMMGGGGMQPGMGGGPQGMMGGPGGQPGMGGPPGIGAGGAGAVPGGGTPQQSGAVGPGGESGSDASSAGRSTVPVT
jgi:hypothetical protein